MGKECFQSILSRVQIGKSCRGVTQYDGSALESVIFDFDNSINISKARELIKNFLNA